MNQGAAVEETDMRSIVRKRTLRTLCERAREKEVRKREMNVFYSELRLITSLGIKCSGINYPHSPSECSALGKQEYTVYS